MEERVVKRDSEAKKSLHITMIDGKPKFEFLGDWIGKNILLIRRLIPRMYQRYVRSVRLTNRRNTDERRD